MNRQGQDKTDTVLSAELNDQRWRERPIEWPTLATLVRIIAKNWLVGALAVAAVGLTGLTVFRSLEKGYRSRAVISFNGFEIANPAKELGAPDTVSAGLNLHAAELREMRAFILAQAALARAAEDVGLLGRARSQSGVSRSLKSLAWGLFGGEFNLDPKAQERLFLDKIRDENIGFDGGQGLYAISFVDADPAMAQRFLDRLLNVADEQAAASEDARRSEVEKFFDTQLLALSERVAADESRTDQKQVRQRLQRLAGMRDEIQALQQNEVSLRSGAESGLVQKRRDLADARARYSSQHPAVQELQAAVADAESRLGAPVARIRRELADARSKLDQEFGAFAAASEASFDAVGAVSESHSQYFGKDRSDRRSLGRVYERVLERRLQATLQSQIDILAGKGRVKIIETASAPVNPESPRVKPAFMLTTLAALVCGLLAALTWELARRRVADQWVLAWRGRHPVLAMQSAPAIDPLEMTLREAPAKSADDRSSPLAALKRRLIDKQPVIKTGRSDGLFDATADLLTKLSGMPRAHPDVFQCAVMPGGENVSSGIVALNLATLCARNGDQATFIVSFDRAGALLHHLRSLELLAPATELRRLAAGGSSERTAPSDSRRGRFHALKGSSLHLFDASGVSSAEVGQLVASMGHGANVIWDLPTVADFACMSVQLPWMPLVAVVEAGAQMHTDLTQAAAWLDVAQRSRGLPVGYYLANAGEAA